MQSFYEQLRSCLPRGTSGMDADGQDALIDRWLQAWNDSASDGVNLENFRHWLREFRGEHQPF